MAPLLKTTIQLLLGYSQTYRPQLQAAKPVVPCHRTQSQIADSVTVNGPSLSTISWGYNRLDVYGTDQVSGNILHKWWDGYQWGPSVSGLEPLEGVFASPPSAVSGNTSKMDVFSVNKNDKSLQHKYYDGYSWQPSSGWDNLKGQVDPSFAPSATSWAPGRLDVFFKGVSNALYLVYYDGSSWGPSDSDNEDLGGELFSGPAAVSWGPNRNDVFAISSLNALIHKYWDGTNWSDWETFDLDVQFYETPSAISWGENRLDVFGVNEGGSLSHLYWDGSQWSKIEDLGGDELTGTVAATSSPNRIDIVALGEDGQYYYKYYDGTSWQPSVSDWYPKGGSFSSAPSVVSWTKDANQRLDIFGITSDYQLGHQTWYGSGWYPGSTEWEKLGGSFEVFSHRTSGFSSQEL